MTNSNRQKELKEWYKEALDENTTSERLEKIFNGTTSGRIRKAVLSNGNVPTHLVRSTKALSHLEGAAGNTALEIKVMFGSDKNSTSVAKLLTVMDDKYIQDPNITAQGLERKMVQDGIRHAFLTVCEKIILSENRSLLDKLKFIFIGTLGIDAGPKRLLSRPKILSALKKGFQNLDHSACVDLFRDFSAEFKAYFGSTPDDSNFVSHSVGKELVQLSYTILLLGLKKVISEDVTKSLFELVDDRTDEWIINSLVRPDRTWSSVFYRAVTNSYVPRLHWNDPPSLIHEGYLRSLAYIDFALRYKAPASIKTMIYQSLYQAAVGSRHGVYSDSHLVDRYVVGALRSVVRNSKFPREDRYVHALISVYNCQIRHTGSAAENVVLKLFKGVFERSDFEAILMIAGGINSIAAYFRSLSVEKTNFNSKAFLKAYNAKKLESNSPA